MFDWIKRLFRFGKSTAPTEVTLREAVRLTDGEYNALRSKLPNTMAPSTVEEYAYRLGVQHTLSVLREGWVIDDS